jgi:hypothetical protein
MSITLCLNKTDWLKVVSMAAFEPVKNTFKIFLDDSSKIEFFQMKN